MDNIENNQEVCSRLAIWRTWLKLRKIFLHRVQLSCFPLSCNSCAKGGEVDVPKLLTTNYRLGDLELAENTYKGRD